jgi:hypothetical protein
MASLSQIEPVQLQPDQRPRFISTLKPSVETIPLPPVEQIPLPSEPGPQPDEEGEVFEEGGPESISSAGIEKQNDK